VLANELRKFARGQFDQPENGAIPQTGHWRLAQRIHTPSPYYQLLQCGDRNQYLMKYCLQSNCSFVPQLGRCPDFSERPVLVKVVLRVRNFKSTTSNDRTARQNSLLMTDSLSIGHGFDAAGNHGNALVSILSYEVS